MFDADQYKLTTRQQWQDDVWNEIETALGQYDTDVGFVGSCEPFIAGATR